MKQGRWLGSKLVSKQLSELLLIASMILLNNKLLAFVFLLLTLTISFLPLIVVTLSLQRSVTSVNLLPSFLRQFMLCHFLLHLGDLVRIQRVADVFVTMDQDGHSPLLSLDWVLELECRFLCFSEVASVHPSKILQCIKMGMQRGNSLTHFVNVVYCLVYHNHASFLRCFYHPTKSLIDSLI